MPMLLTIRSEKQHPAFNSLFINREGITLKLNYFLQSFLKWRNFKAMFIHPSKLAVEYFIIKLVSALEKGRVIIISALYI